MAALTFRPLHNMHQGFSLIPILRTLSRCSHVHPYPTAPYRQLTSFAVCRAAPHPYPISPYRLQTILRTLSCCSHPYSTAAYRLQTTIPPYIQINLVQDLSHAFNLLPPSTSIQQYRIHPFSVCVSTISILSDPFQVLVSFHSIPAVIRIP